jgi:hypothetical protein
MFRADRVLVKLHRPFEERPGLVLATLLQSPNWHRDPHSLTIGDLAT